MQRGWRCMQGKGTPGRQTCCPSSKDSTQGKTGHKRTRHCTHRGIGKSRAGANAGGERRCALCASRQRVAKGMACTMCAAEEVMCRMHVPVECVTWAPWLHSHTHHRKKVSSSSAWACAAPVSTERADLFGSFLQDPGSGAPPCPYTRRGVSRAAMPLYRL